MTERAGSRDRLHVVLLAGGAGTRFWPWSRSDRPKQFLPLAGREPLLVGTWKRARKLAPASRVWVVAPARYAAEVRGMLPDLPRRNLVVEPSPRDTAPAVGLACAAVERRDPGAIVALLPTDHVIRDARAFHVSIGTALSAARQGALVCLGVVPDRPATGYGYIRCAEPPRADRAAAVARFVEKPDEARARRFLRSGRYLWNAGMFVWQAGRILDELARLEPATRRAIDAVLVGRPGGWNRARRVSIDRAVLERTRGIRVVGLSAGWDDVGSWGAAARLRPEGAGGRRSAVLHDSPGTVVFAGDRLVAVVGAPGLVVVDAGDAVLVAERGRAQEVREVVARLKRERREELL